MMPVLAKIGTTEAGAFMFSESWLMPTLNLMLLFVGILYESGLLVFLLLTLILVFGLLN